jgi:hypothetical protein
MVWCSREMKNLYNGLEYSCNIEEKGSYEGGIGLGSIISKK